MLSFFPRNTNNELSLNSANTISLYYSKDEDYVTKLKFYQLGKNNSIYKSTSNIPLKKLSTFDSHRVKFASLCPNLMNFLNPQKKKKVQRYSLKKQPFTLYEKRMEHENYEIKREKLHDELSNKINMLKKQIKRNYSHLDSVRKKIEDIKTEISVLNDFGQYSLFEEKCKKADIILDKLDFKKSVTLKSLIHQQISKIQVIALEKTNIKHNLTEEYERIFNEIKKDEEHLQKIREKYTILKNDLIIHYHNILEEGRDTRFEGLTWVIKRIWKFEEEVILSYLPKFLDAQSIAFLFEISRLSIEKDHQEKGLRELYKKIICCKVEKNQDKFFKTSSSNMTSNSKKVTNNDFENNLNGEIIQNLLEQLDKKLNLIENTPNLSFQKIDDIMNDGNKGSVIDDKTNVYIKAIQKKKNYIKNIQAKIESMKQSEVERINREFLNHDYQRRFNVPIYTVISALIGEEKLEQEMGKIQKKSRMFAKTLRSIQSFSFLNFKKNKISFPEDEEES